MMSYQEKLDKKLGEVATKYGITIEQAKTLRAAMDRTWSRIAYDVMDGFDACGEHWSDVYKDEAEMSAEMALDANRIIDDYDNGDVDLSWVYKKEDGSFRSDVIALGESVLRADGRN